MPYHSTMSTAPNPTMSEARCTKSAIACSHGGATMSVLSQMDAAQPAAIAT